MTAEELNSYNRQEFETDAAAMGQLPCIDALEAERLTRVAHFGIQWAQDPSAELGHYAAKISGLCRSSHVEAEALLIFLSFLENGARPATEDPFMYCVRAGDTLAALAHRFGAAAEKLIQANPLLTPPTFLFVNARIHVPGNLTYVVRRGETLDHVAAHLTEYVQCFDPEAQVTVPDLLARNQLPHPHLVTDQVLAFPLVALD